jgi:hypothetical protein
MGPIKRRVRKDITDLIEEAIPRLLGRAWTQQEYARFTQEYPVPVTDGAFLQINWRGEGERFLLRWAITGNPTNGALAEGERWMKVLEQSIRGWAKHRSMKLPGELFISRVGPDGVAKELLRKVRLE